MMDDVNETALVSEMFSNIEELDSTIENEIFRNSDGFCPLYFGGGWSAAF